MKLPLAVTAALAALATVRADDIADTTTTQCSCSPTTYNFILNFAGTCSSSAGLDDKPELVEGSVCFFTKGDPADIIDDGASIDFGGAPSSGSRMGEKLPKRNYVGLRKLLSSSEEELEEQQAGQHAGQHAGQQLGRQWWLKSVLEGVDFSKEKEHAKLLAAKYAKHQHEQVEEGGRTLQAGLDTTPITVTSVTFLEADSTPQLNIINQDSTYFDTSSSDGDLLSYTSISASLDVARPLTDQVDSVPGGVMMVLFGINSDGEVIQNTVAWAYNLDNCEEVPLEEGDGVGWVTVGGGWEPPHAEFCEGVTDAPTRSPIADPPVAGSTMATVVTTTAKVVTTEATESPPATTTEMPVITGKSSKGTKSTKGVRKW